MQNLISKYWQAKNLSKPYNSMNSFVLFDNVLPIEITLEI